MSETERLVIDAKKSLYAPTEIEIGGQVYLSVKTTNTLLMAISKLDDECDKEKDEGKSTIIIYKILHLLFDIDVKILEILDRREVQDIYTFCKRKFLEIEKQRLELVKKTFGNIWGTDKQKVTAIVPNGKRSGNKQ